MVHEHEFEGELLIEDIPAEYRDDVINLIRSYGKRTREMDPQNRIIEIGEIKGGYRVTTTENQLADRLGKK